MYCNHCGAKLPVDASFCQSCGKAVISETSDTTAPYSSLTGHEPTAQASNSLGAADELQPARPRAEGQGNQVRPWVRYWARMVDIILWAFPAGLFLGVLAPHLVNNSSSDYLVGMLVLLMWAFVEPLCLSVFGTTPGKRLLKIRLVYTSPNELSYGAALSRSVKVWWRGLAAGLPLISLFTLITAYSRLKANGQTSWDAEGGFIVTHQPVGIGRGILVLALLFVYFFIIGFISEASRG